MIDIERARKSDSFIFARHAQKQKKPMRNGKRQSQDIQSMKPLQTW